MGDDRTMQMQVILGRAAILALYFRLGLVVAARFLPAINGVPKTPDLRRWTKLRKRFRQPDTEKI